MTKTIALIPARKGSKRLPGKNRKLLLGKPLIEYTVEVALKCDFIDVIIVISDDPWIQSYYLGYKRITVIDAPESISQDDSQAWEVVNYVLKLFYPSGRSPEIIDVIYLQPTSPLRDARDIKLAWEMYQNNYGDSITSVTYKDKWTYKLNGAIYISPHYMILSYKSLWKQANHLYIMPKERSVDIDTIEDWNEAERILKQ